MKFKKCDKCLSNVEMGVLQCPKCDGTSFTHLSDEEMQDTTYGSNANLRAKDSPKSTVKKVEKLESPKAAAAPAQLEIADLVEAVKSSNAEVIRAQNRTTHAIRAFVRFLFIQLSATTLAAFIYSSASSNINAAECATSGRNCSANGGLIFLAAIIWIAGVVLSSRAGWDELEASNIPGE